MLNYRRIVLLWFLAILCVPATAQGVTFDYRYYEPLLKRRGKPGIFIDGVTVAAFDYAALAMEPENDLKHAE